MARTAFIHMGAHKTGSTAVQGWLKSNADALQGAGLSLPLHLAGEKFNFPSLAVALCNTPKDRLPPHKATLQNFTDWLNGLSDGDVIVSAERFSTSAARSPMGPCERYFAHRGFRTEAVFFIRNRLDWLNSSIAQRAKRLNSSAILSRPVVPDIVQRMNWQRSLARIEKTGITVRAAVYPPRDGTPLPEQFCKLTGIDQRLPTDISFETPSKNASLGEIGVLLGISVRDLLPDRATRHQRLAISGALIQAMTDLPDARFNGLNERQIAALEENFAATDAQLLRWIPNDDLTRLGQSTTKGLPRSPLRPAQMNGEQARIFAEAASRIADSLAQNAELAALIDPADIRALVPPVRPFRKATV